MEGESQLSFALVRRWFLLAYSCCERWETRKGRYTHQLAILMDLSGGPAQ